eukprot:8549989-Pyramimonas_sp.AAC.1
MDGRVWLSGGASGGKHSSHARLRRITWAVVSVAFGADPREVPLPSMCFWSFWRGPLWPASGNQPG